MEDNGRLPTAATGDNEEWGDPWDDYLNGRAAFEDLSEEDQRRAVAHALGPEIPVAAQTRETSGGRAFIEAPDFASMSDEDIDAFAKRAWAGVVGYPASPGTIAPPSLWMDSDWKTRRWTCSRCGWSGSGDEAECEPFAELFELNCPECPGRLALISYRNAPE